MLILKKFYLKPKFFSVMKKYSAKQFTNDLIAGIIVAIIALPLSIALALASGVEPACGIYTAIAAGFCVSLFGGSRIQIAGPTAAFASIVAGVVASQGMDGLFIATVIAGILLILMGIFRFGSLIKFIPHTITTGFTSGIAVTILIGQIKDFLGLTYAEGVKPIETIEKIEANIEFIDTFSWQSLVVGAVCLAILIFYPKVEKRVPPSLIAVVVGALMVAFLPGFDEGVFTIRDLYTIPAGLPKVVDLGGMDLSFEKISSVLPDAFTIAVLAAIESLLSCVVADGMVNSRHNSNAELVGQGIGNIASVFLGGIPATGAIARTAANAKNGGRTPVAGMVHAVVLLLVLLFLMPYAGLIPMPTIAAILFMVAYNMSEWKKFVRIVKTAPKSDILILIVTFALTVIFDLVVAIGVGMVLAAMLFIKRMSDETSVNGWKYIDPDTDADGIDLKVVPKDVRVYEISGPLFFGAADKIPEIILKDYTRCLILRMRAVPSLDSTALNALELLLEKCEKQGVTLIISHVNEQPLHVMKKSGFYEKVGEENFCAHIDEALSKAGSAAAK